MARGEFFKPRVTRAGGQGLVTTLLDRYEAGLGYWQPQFDYKRSLMRDYRQELKLVIDPDTNKPLWPHRAKIFTPDTYEKACTVVPSVMSAIFGRENFFTVTRRKGRRFQGDVDLTRQVLEFQTEERNLRGQMWRVIPETVLLGDKITRPRWIREKQLFEERKKAYDLGVPIGVEAVDEAEVYEGPDLVRIPFYRFIIDPDTPPCELQEASWIIEEDILPEWKFLIWAEAEEWGDKTRREQILEASRSKGSRQSGAQATAQPSDEWGRYAHLLYYWDHERYGVIAVDGSVPAGGYVLKDKPFHKICPSGKYPHIPFYARFNIDEGVETGEDAVADYHPSGFHPPGLLHPMHQLQQVQNTQFCQRQDQINLSMGPPVVLASGALEDEAELEFGYEPNMILHTAARSGVDISKILHQLQLFDFIGAGYHDNVKLVLDYFSRVSGANDIISGKFDEANPTATAALQLTSNSHVRFSSDVEMITRNGLEPLLESWIELNARYLDADTVLYITDDEMAQQVFVNPEDIVRGALVRVRTMPHYVRQLGQAEMMRKAPLIAQMHPFVNLTEMTRQILESDDYFEGIDNILPKDTPPVRPVDLPIIQALAQVQAKMQAMGMAGPMAGMGAGGMLPQGGRRQLGNGPGGGLRSMNVPQSDVAAEMRMGGSMGGMVT